MPEKTIRQQPVVKTDLAGVHLHLEEGGMKSWNATYLPKDETGASIGTEPRTAGGSVTQDPGLWAWVDGVVIPAINAQEGTA
jgi:hypothetical protein